MARCCYNRCGVLGHRYDRCSILRHCDDRCRITIGRCGNYWSCISVGGGYDWACVSVWIICPVIRIRRTGTKSGNGTNPCCQQAEFYDILHGANLLFLKNLMGIMTYSKWVL